MLTYSYTVPNSIMCVAYCMPKILQKLMLEFHMCGCTTTVSCNGYSNYTHLLYAVV